MAETKSYPTRIKGWINILDLDTNKMIFEKVPVSLMNLRFVLHAVPTATFVLNVGRDAKTRKLAEIHEKAGELSGKVRVHAYLDLDGQESPSRAWPQKAFRVFDGVSTGVGYNTSRGDNSFYINAAHWLEELDAGAVASAGLTKNSGDNFLAVVGFNTDGRATSMASQQAVSVIGLPDNSDLWKDVVRPMLKVVMGYKPKPDATDMLDNPRFQNLVMHLQSICSPIKGVEVKPGNDRAIELITKRFNTVDQIIPGKLKISHLDAGGSLSIRGFMRDYVAQIISANIGNATALEKILSTGSNFMFMLAMNVESATLAPIVPALHNSILWRTITSSEYSFVEGQAFTPRVLASVALLGREYMAADVPNMADGAQIIQAVGAFHAFPKGQTAFFTAPPWLLVNVPESFTRQTVNNGRVVGPRNSGNTQALGAAIRKTIDQLKTVGCKFAHALWTNEVFKHRTTAIKGRLRFDICPGSTIALKGVGEKLPQFDTESLFGLVSGVDITVDAATPQASTQIILSHIRTDKEQDRLPKKHPLFDESWIGSPLVKLADIDIKPEKGQG